MTKPLPQEPSSGEIDEKTLATAVAELARTDADLGQIVDEYGAPPLWSREPTFSTIVLIVLEQQVSLSSARSVFERLASVTGSLTPTALLDLSDSQLRTIGFSRQKAGYARSIAEGVLAGRLDLTQIARLETVAARAQLEQVRGIGLWSSAIFALLAMRRPDIWPPGDLALSAACRQIKGLTVAAGTDEIAALADGWRPWRSVAARILWHYYLSRGPGARTAQGGYRVGNLG